MPKYLSIDRFEGKYAICEDAEQKYFAIETSELPAGAAEGSVLLISDDGILSLEAEETDRRRKEMAEKQRKIFGE